MSIWDGVTDQPEWEREGETNWVTPWPADWSYGALDPWEDWVWESLPLSPEYLLYLSDVVRSTTIPIVPSP